MVFLKTTKTKGKDAPNGNSLASSSWDVKEPRYLKMAFCPSDVLLADASDNKTKQLLIWLR